MLKLSMAGAWPCLLAAALATTSAAHAQAADDLTELSLQELTNVKVTTFAKRPQRAADVAAALFVITQDDIRRSGATSIPEALRLAPGLQVARIDGNKWAISARGFSGRFANKLLVLMDGRTLYTPSFGGVYWDAQDLLIDDIERIEVIRGPAGTTWGTNAVNGIINIITKRADQTDGFLVGSDYSDGGSATLNVRLADADGADTRWRIYAKAFDHAANELERGGDAYDDAEQQRIGAKLEHELGNDQTLKMSVEGYQGRSHHTFTGTFMQPVLDPTTPLIDATETLDGAWASAGWSRTLSAHSTLELQGYIDHSDRNGPVYGEERDTVDVDFQHAFTGWQSHTVTWGIGVRYSHSRLEAMEPILVDDDNARFLLGSAYVQDEVRLLDDRLTVTAGTRVEDSNLDDATLLPNLRAHFALTNRSAIWGAVARGARRPSRIEQDFRVEPLGEPLPPGSAMNPLPVPAVRALIGNESFDAERMNAYESGWRWQARENLSVDVALFYNEYAHLRSLGLMPPYCSPSGELLATNPMCMLTANYVVIPANAGNATSGHSKGGELVVGWTPVRYWRVIGTYSHIRTALREVTPDPSTLLFILGQDPRHQYSLRSSLSIGPRWDWDLFVKSRSSIDVVGLDAATQLDSRIAWRPSLDLEVALIGRNLLKSAQVEAKSELFDLASVAIDRDARLQIRWSFR